MATRKTQPAATEENVQQEHKLSSGVRFYVRPVPTLLLYDVQQHITTPEPPRIQMKHKGEVFWTEDYDNEIFRDRYEEALRKRNMASMEVIIRRGCELAPGQLPADDNWLEDLEIDLGPTLDPYRGPDGEIRERHKPYLYLRYVGIRGRDDFDKITTASTLTEADVAEAEEAFPGN